MLFYSIPKQKQKQKQETEDTIFFSSENWRDKALLINNTKRKQRHVLFYSIHLQNEDVILVYSTLQNKRENRSLELFYSIRQTKTKARIEAWSSSILPKPETKARNEDMKLFYSYSSTKQTKATKLFYSNKRNKTTSRRYDIQYSAVLKTKLGHYQNECPCRLPFAASSYGETHCWG